MSNREDNDIPKIKRDGNKIILDGVGEYQLAGQAIYFDLNHLQISHCVKTSYDEESKDPPVFESFICGEATVERDFGLGVIGYDDTYTKKASLNIRSMGKKELSDICKKRLKFQEKNKSKDKDSLERL